MFRPIHVICDYVLECFVFRILLIFILTVIIYCICIEISLKKPNRGKKRKHKFFSLNDKLHVIEKIEKERLCQVFVRNMGLLDRLSLT